MGVHFPLCVLGGGQLSGSGVGTKQGDRQHESLLQATLLGTQESVEHSRLGGAEFVLKCMRPASSPLLSLAHTYTVTHKVFSNPTGARLHSCPAFLTPARDPKTEGGSSRQGPSNSSRPKRVRAPWWGQRGGRHRRGRGGGRREKGEREEKGGRERRERDRRGERKERRRKRGREGKGRGGE